MHIEEELKITEIISANCFSRYCSGLEKACGKPVPWTKNPTTKNTPISKIHVFLLRKRPFVTFLLTFLLRKNYKRIKSTTQVNGDRLKDKKKIMGIIIWFPCYRNPFYCIIFAALTKSLSQTMPTATMKTKYKNINDTRGLVKQK